MYYSVYSDAEIDALASRIQADNLEDREVWCIFDNTTLGGATRNALDLRARLSDESGAA